VIAKFLRTPSFAVATRYVLDRDPDLHHQDARALDTNMAGQTHEEFTEQLEAARAGNWRTQKVVAHVVLRLSPEDRQLSDRQWTRIAGEYLQQMGYHDTPYLVVKHPFPEQHVHIVASRIRFDGERVKDGYERVRSRTIVRALEREHHLVHTQERLHQRERGRGYEREHERSVG